MQSSENTGAVRMAVELGLKKPVDDDDDETGGTVNFRASRAARWQTGKRSDQLFELEIAERLPARFGRIAVTPEERRRACFGKGGPSAGEQRSDRGGRRASGLRRAHLAGVSSSGCSCCL